ncbi:MAG: ABC transporter permease [Bacteroidales bacterium]|nr:ABC transporter permease [Bacteroidales bacterium]
MIRHLFKYSFRALARQKSYVAINIIGLTISLVCSMIIALFIIDELSYDQYNENKDRIYRVILNGKMGGQEVTVTSTASPIGPTMLNEFPEVESFLRMNGWGETILKYDGKYFTEKRFIEVDSTFFDFFSIPLLRGNSKTVLNEKRNLVLSESTALKIFGNIDPMNKLIQIGNDTTFHRVTGIMEDIPDNTHFQASALGSFMTNPRSGDGRWLSNSFSTYVMLKPGSSPESANARFIPMIEKYVGPVVTKYFGISLEEFLSQGNKYNMYLQKLTNIHLDPSIEQEFKAANDPRYLWIFGSIAVLIMIIAAVNFMNLSTALAAKRAKEVGIKKVSGSSKNMLVVQFLVETMLLAFFALIAAVVITEITLPYFNNVLNINLKLALFKVWYTIPALLILSGFIGLLAGAYPAFYLSSFSPYMVLKGRLRSGRRQGQLRSALVVLQFSISIVLIIGTMIMFRQLNYMQDKDPGFKKEQIMVISEAHAIGKKLNSFKEELKKISGVISVSSSTAIPGHNNNNNGYRIKGRVNESFLLQTCWADFDFFETYRMEIVSGRYFDPSMGTDTAACIINESAVKSYTLTDPFATRFLVSDDEPEEIQMPVIGVVKDFHHESLRSPISPYIFRFKNEEVNWGFISLRLSENYPNTVVEDIENAWSSFAAGSPMQSFFLDKDFERMYREEEQNAQLSIIFTILGIVIAALGLYGLTSFTVVQRTKEIGVRKAFGATVGNIWYLIAREIVILVIISSAIAVPLSWMVADNWLQNFHYRITLQVPDFLYGIMLAITIALLTISYRAIKTARANPTESLRYE